MHGQMVICPKTLHVVQFLFSTRHVAQGEGGVVGRFMMYLV